MLTSIGLPKCFEQAKHIDNEPKRHMIDVTTSSVVLHQKFRPQPAEPAAINTLLLPISITPACCGSGRSLTPRVADLWHQLT